MRALPCIRAQSAAFPSAGDMAFLNAPSTPAEAETPLTERVVVEAGVAGGGVADNRGVGVAGNAPSFWPMASGLPVKV